MDSVDVNYAYYIDASIAGAVCGAVRIIGHGVYGGGGLHPVYEAVAAIIITGHGVYGGGGLHPVYEAVDAIIIIGHDGYGGGGLHPVHEAVAAIINVVAATCFMVNGV